MTAGRLAENRNVARVTAELTDISLHPLHRELLIHQAVIPCVMTFRVERGLREESQVAEAVLDRDDDTALVDERSRVIVRAGAAGQPATVNPEHHGRRATAMLVAVFLEVGHVDVQEQTVFAALATLGAYVAECRRFAQALPCAETLRWRPA